MLPTAIIILLFIIFPEETQSEGRQLILSLISVLIFYHCSYKKFGTKYGGPMRQDQKLLNLN